MYWSARSREGGSYLRPGAAKWVSSSAFSTSSESVSRSVYAWNGVASCCGGLAARWDGRKRKASKIGNGAFRRFVVDLAGFGFGLWDWTAGNGRAPGSADFQVFHHSSAGPDSGQVEVGAVGAGGQVGELLLLLLLLLKWRTGKVPHRSLVALPRSGR